MLSILSNITRLSDSTIQSFFYKFWATPVLMYVSSVYTFCLVAICVCMYFNRRDNLIYKVLNLAVLSVFVVALWSYLTDVTFIYVVYILTFVSAVVMLFLSVVLMLPSSAVAVPKRSSGYIILAFFTDSSSFFYGISFVTVLAVIYAISAYYNRPGNSSIYSALDVDTSKLTGLQLSTVKSLAENFSYIAVVKQDVCTPPSTMEFSYLNNSILSITGYTGLYPIYLAAQPKTLYKQSIYLQSVLQPVYEVAARFLATDTARIFLPERLVSLASSQDLKLFNIIGQHGITIYINNNKQQKVVLILDRPWWSPFIVLPNAVHYISAFIKPVHFNIAVDSGRRGILNIFLLSPLKGVIVFLAKLLTKVRTRIIDGLGIAGRLIANQAANVSSMTLETIAQTAAAWSIFLVALPSSQLITYRNDFSAASIDYQGASSGLENLAKIQYELYVGSPLLMLVCVVGLLVALIGAALLVSTKVLNSK